MMTDFKAAFQKGLEAHDNAARAKEEIDGVLKEFARQVYEASGNKIKIQHAQKTREVEDTPQYVDKMLLLTGQVPMPRIRRESYWAIVAQPDASSNHQEVLCEYEVSSSGYPVVLKYGDTVSSCYDQKSLERGLQELLEDPDKAGQLKRIIRLVDDKA